MVIQRPLLLMSEEKWDIVFNNWNDRNQTYYIVRIVLICSIIISGSISTFSFLTKSDFRYFSLGYSILYIILLGIFYFIENHHILLVFLGSIVLGFPAWMFWKQDPHTIAYISVLLIVTAAVITKFRFTTIIFSFILTCLVTMALLDVFGVYNTSDPSNTLAIESLLHIPLLVTN